MKYTEGRRGKPEIGVMVLQPRGGNMWLAQGVLAWQHLGRVTPQVGDAASQEEWIGKSKSAEMSWTTIHAQPSLSMGK